MMQIAWEIEQRIRRFAWLNDRHDHDGLAEMFTTDGVFIRPTEPDQPVKGRETIRQFFRERPRRATRHVMTNTLVELLGRMEASATSYVVLHLADRALVGDFQDRLVLENGVWLFAHRRGSLAF